MRDGAARAVRRRTGRRVIGPPTLGLHARTPRGRRASAGPPPVGGPRRPERYAKEMGHGVAEGRDGPPRNRITGSPAPDGEPDGERGTARSPGERGGAREGFGPRTSGAGFRGRSTCARARDPHAFGCPGGGGGGRGRYRFLRGRRDLVRRRGRRRRRLTRKPRRERRLHARSRLARRGPPLVAKHIYSETDGGGEGGGGALEYFVRRARRFRCCFIDSHSVGARETVSL